MKHSDFYDGYFRASIYQIHMNQSPKDEILVKRTLEDKQYFGELIDRYEAKLSRYLVRLGVRSPEDRQDVLQEIFLKVYKNLNGFNPTLSFSSWIYRIAHNEAISWYRKQNVRPEGHLVAEPENVMAILSSDLTGADQQFDEKINAEELGRAMGSLDEKYREVLILRFFEHKEYEEISDILRIPIGSVGTLIHRGKKQLQRELNNDSIRI